MHVHTRAHLLSLLRSELPERQRATLLLLDDVASVEVVASPHKRCLRDAVALDANGADLGDKMWHVVVFNKYMVGMHHMCITWISR